MITFCSMLWYAVFLCICIRAVDCSFARLHFLRHATRLVALGQSCTNWHLQWCHFVSLVLKSICTAIAYMKRTRPPSEGSTRMITHVKTHRKTWWYSETLLGFCDGKALGGIPKLTFCWLLSQMWLYFWSPCLINFVATSIDILWFKNVQYALHKVLHKVTEAAAGMWVQNLGLKYRCLRWSFEARQNMSKFHAKRQEIGKLPSAQGVPQSWCETFEPGIKKVTGPLWIRSKDCQISAKLSQLCPQGFETLSCMVGPLDHGWTMVGGTQTLARTTCNYLRRSCRSCQFGTPTIGFLAIELVMLIPPAWSSTRNWTKDWGRSFIYGKPVSIRSTMTCSCANMRHVQKFQEI